MRLNSYKLTSLSCLVILGDFQVYIHNGRSAPVTTDALEALTAAQLVSLNIALLTDMSLSEQHRHTTHAAIANDKYMVGTTNTVAT